MAFFVASLWLILTAAWKAYRSHWLSLDVFLFTVGAIALFLISCMGNLRTRDHFGRSHLMLFGGIAYSYRLHQVEPGTDPGNPDENQD
jgi:hypothetical protein